MLLEARRDQEDIVLPGFICDQYLWPQHLVRSAG